MKFIIIIFAFLIFFGISSEIFNDDVHASAFIYKSITHSVLNWSDEVEINVTIFNTNSRTISDVMVSDTVPLGFTSTSTTGIVTDSERLVFRVDTMQPGEEKKFSYKIKPLEGIKSDNSIDVNLPRATMTYSIEDLNLNEESNLIKITIQESKQWWEENIVPTVALLIVISFGFGTFGTVIHNQNQNLIKKDKENTKQDTGANSTPISTATGKTKEKDQQSEKTETEKTQYHPLLGGVAGIVVLASFEGLSSLFANGQLQPSVQNIVVLIATSLAAGFTPIAVIDKMTSKFKVDAQNAQTQNKLLEDSNKTIKENAERIETDKKIIANDNKELQSKVNEKNTGVSLGKTIIEQLQAENEELKMQISEILSGPKERRSK